MQITYITPCHVYTAYTSYFLHVFSRTPCKRKIYNPCYAYYCFHIILIKIKITLYNHINNTFMITL